MTTLEPSKVFDIPANDHENDYDDDDGGDGYQHHESQALIQDTETGITQRKITVRTISTKDLDLDNNDEEEDDYYEEVLLDNDGYKSSQPLFSFTFYISNASYTISIPTLSQVYDKLVGIDTAPMMRVGWIVLTLYVMTETLRRFDDRTGAFSGMKAIDRIPHAGHPIDPFTIYGNQMNPNGNAVLPEGMTVSQPQQSSLLNPNPNIDATIIPNPSNSQTQAQMQAQPQIQSPATPVLSPYGQNQTPFAVLPPLLTESLSDLMTPFSANETPLYWHIPRSGGTMMKTILGTCLGKIMVSEIGILDGHDQDQTLMVVERQRPLGKFVNVDVSTLPGIERAKTLGLGSNQLAQVMASSHFQEISSLYQNTPLKGRWFSLMRHPVDRAISLFYFLKGLQAWGPEYTNLSLEDYVQSSFVESNWMIRYLIGKKSGDVGLEELEMAKEILRTKVLIGLLEDVDTSLNRFLQYFGWKIAGEDERQCVSRLVQEKKVGQNIHEVVSEQSDVWQALMRINNWDLKLYDYARLLFQQQQSLVNPI